MNQNLLLGLSLIVIASACNTQPIENKGASAPENAAQAAVKKSLYGEKITITEVTPIASLVKEPSKYKDKVIITQGTVSAVCKSMGCWMEITDEAGTAHIKMAGHTFFVPKDSAGKKAIVQGKLIVQESAEGTCGGDKADCEGHAKGEDCKAEAMKQTGKAPNLEFEATGVELIN